MYSFLLMELLLLLVLGYYVGEKTLLSPTLMMSGMFIISVSVAMINVGDWGSHLSFATAQTIVTAILAVAIGEAVAKHFSIFRNEWKNDCQKCGENYSLSVSKLKIVPLSMFMAFVDYQYYRYIYRLSLLAGNTGGIRQMIPYARVAIVNPNLSTGISPLLSHSLVVVDCLGIIFMATVIWTLVWEKQFIWYYSIPCVLYLVRIGLSTARIGFIRYILFALATYIFVKGKKSREGDKISLKSLLIIVIAIYLVFVGFRLLGYLTGKSNVRGLWSDLSNYTGSSIVALDMYLESPPARNPFFGKETLYGLYSMLRGLGLSKVERYGSTLPFVYYGFNKGTNIYTAFRRLIQDYGYIGIYPILFLESFFYKKWLAHSKGRHALCANDVLCLYHIYMIALSSIDEQFIATIVTMRFVYLVIYLSILWKLLIDIQYQNTDILDTFGMC